MPTLDDVKLDSLYYMFKGEPGTRKSSSALSFASLGEIYFFDVDKKIESLLIPAKKWGIPKSSITYDTYNDWNAIIKKLKELEMNCKKKTLVIDSITSVGDAINAQTKRLKSGTTTSAGAEAGKRIGGITVNSMEDYQAEASAFQELVAITKSIKEMNNTNIILIAHVIGERKNEAKATHFARIIVTGGKIISAKIPAYCPEVYHFDVESEVNAAKGGKYKLFTEHMGDDFARTALPLAREIIFGDEPLYEKFIKPAIEQLLRK